MASTMGPLNNVTTSIVATMLDKLNKGILNGFKPGGPMAMFAFRGVFISVVSTSDHLDQAGTLKRQMMRIHGEKVKNFLRNAVGWPKLFSMPFSIFCIMSNSNSKLRN